MSSGNNQKGEGIYLLQIHPLVTPPNHRLFFFYSIESFIGAMRYTSGYCFTNSKFTTKTLTY